MKILNEPDMSPQSKSIRNSECLSSLSMEDFNKAKIHLKETNTGLNKQFKDSILFQIDNTEVSRNDYIFSNKRNS